MNAQFRLKKFDEVLAGTDQILAEVDQSYPRWKALDLRSQTLKELGRIEEAFETLVKAREEEQTRLSERAREQSSFMAAVFEDQKRSNELALAQQRSEAAESLVEAHQAEACCNRKLRRWSDVCAMHHDCRRHHRSARHR